MVDWIKKTIIQTVIKIVMFSQLYLQQKFYKFNKKVNISKIHTSFGVWDV